MLSSTHTSLARVATLLLVLCVLLALCSVASACPTCKEGIGGDESNVKEGYFWSIIFMMSMPFLIFAGLGTYFFLLVWKSRRNRAAAELARAEAAEFAVTGDRDFAVNADREQIEEPVA